MKYNIKKFQNKQLSENIKEEEGNIIEEVDDNIVEGMEEDEEEGDISENQEDEEDEDTYYASGIERNANFYSVDKSGISIIESKVDWNLVSLSSIWIFLTITFFGIFF